MYKRYILLLFTFLILTVSCDEDDWTYEEYLVNQYWEVDLLEYSYSMEPEPLFSVFYFAWDQYGLEERLFQFDGAFYDRKEFDWYWSPYDRDVLVLDYFHSISFIRVRYMSRSRMEGYYYQDEFDFERGRGIPILLERLR